jgi:HEAT repeat protein
MTCCVRHLCHQAGRPLGRCLAAIFFLLLLLPGVHAADPVDELRDSLATGSRVRASARLLEFRRSELEQRIKALRTVNQLYRSLLLTEWRDDPKDARTFLADPKRYEFELKLFDLDREMRGKVIGRLVSELRTAMRSPEPSARRAAALFIGQMGTKIRAADEDKDRRGLASTLAPDLIKLTRAPDPKDKVTEADTPAVREAAAAALGRINPEPRPVVSAMRQILERDPKTGEYTAEAPERRAAATALGDLIRIVSELQLKGETQRGAEASMQDVVGAATAVVPAAGVGVSDDDAQVRRASLEAMRAAAATLEKLIPEPTDFFKVRLFRDEPFPRYLFPPRNFELSKTEREQIEAAARAVSAEQKLFRPLMDALADQGKTLAAHLVEDKDADVRLLSRKVLEFMASARQRMNRLILSVPPLVVAQGPGVGGVLPAAVQAGPVADDDPLRKGLEPGLDVMARGLGDKDAAVRLAAVEFLEMLDEGARPATAALVQALCDSDPFVRWGAARALFRMAPDEGEKVGEAFAQTIREQIVPGLAKRLDDVDLDARLAMLKALRRYAAFATSAVPALIQATRVGDADSRVEAIHTLEAAAARDDAAPAVQALAAALKNSDSRVRQAAAQALGNFGAAAAPALPALRVALDDPDEDVRRLASESLLTIELAGRKGG